MTWTYVPANLQTSRKDEVRLMTGDTDTTDQLVQDEEINLALSQYPPTTGLPAWQAASVVCEAIANHYARQTQQSIGPLSQAADQMYQHYVERAQQFRILLATKGQGIINTGTGHAFPSLVMLGVKQGAAPSLSGGGNTYLGKTPYMDPEGI